MTSPRSIRLEPDTLTRLSAFAGRRPSMTSAGAAAMLVEEGLRMDAHPGVVFRDGPSGRRAGLANGPDVWEIARAVRAIRASEPDLPDADLLLLVSQDTGLTPTEIQIALGYYGEHPDEIDAWIQDAEAAERRAQRILTNTRRLLGA